MELGTSMLSRKKGNGFIILHKTTDRTDVGGIVFYYA